MSEEDEIDKWVESLNWVGLSCVFGLSLGVVSGIGAWLIPPLFAAFGWQSLAEWTWAVLTAPSIGLIGVLEWKLPGLVVFAMQLVVPAVGMVVVVAPLRWMMNGAIAALRHWEKRNNQKMFGQPLDLAEVSHREFAHADVAYYDRIARELEAAGYRCLGDLEERNESRRFPKMRHFVRLLISADGTTTAAITHLRLRGWTGLALRCVTGGRDVYVIEFETEFEDHASLKTTNSPVKPDPYEHLDVRTLPRATTCEDLMRAHAEAVAEVLADPAHPRPVRIETLADAIASAQHQHALKAEQQAARGWVSPIETGDTDAGARRETHPSSSTEISADPSAEEPIEPRIDSGVRRRRAPLAYALGGFGGLALATGVVLLAFEFRSGANVMVEPPQNWADQVLAAITILSYTGPLALAAPVLLFMFCGAFTKQVVLAVRDQREQD